MAVLKNDSELIVNQAKRDNKAIISIYNINEEDSIIHEKTITLKPLYISK